MLLTNRDSVLLADFQSFGLLETRVIAQRHFGNIAMTTVLRRLRKLEEAGYIQRISGLEDGRIAWALTKQSAASFRPKGSKLHFPRFILDHDLKLAAVRLKLEGSGISRSWRPEHEIRSMIASQSGLTRAAQRNVPDGLMVVQVDGQNETVAVEVELTNKNQSRYRDIFRQYSSKKNLWGFWYIVKNQVIAKQLRKASTDSWHRGNKPFFLWSLLDEVLQEPLTTTVHGYNKSFELEDVWAPARPLSPAHSLAQAMSRPTEELETKETKLSADNQTKTSAQTGIEGTPPTPLATLPQRGVEGWPALTAARE